MPTSVALLILLAISEPAKMVPGGNVPSKELAIAGIRIGDTEASVRSRFGKPTSFRYNGEVWKLRYPGLTVHVGFYENGTKEPRTVSEIFATSATHCTPSGVCPGTNLRVLQARWGKPLVADREDGQFWEYGPPTETCWFQVARKLDRVVSLRIECQP